MEPVVTRTVNCGTCRECCKGDAIYMHPECGDDPSQYLTERYGGGLILQRKPNGDCIYLDRVKGCTIHHSRPTVCRELDCVALVDEMRRRGLKACLSANVVYAARRLKRDGVGSAGPEGK